jgi:hypothetical protein
MQTSSGEYSDSADRTVRVALPYVVVELPGTRLSAHMTPQNGSPDGAIALGVVAIARSTTAVV